MTVSKLQGELMETSTRLEASKRSEADLADKIKRLLADKDEKALLENEALSASRPPCSSHCPKPPIGLG